MRCPRAGSHSRSTRGGSSSSPPCRPAPPICRRGSWANTRSLHPGTHKNPRAGAIEAPPRFGVASSPVLRFDQRGRDRMVSSSWRTQKPTRARARPNPHPAGHPCSPLPGSLFLYMKDGKAWIGLSVLPYTKHLTRARQAEGPIADPVSCLFRGLSPCSWRPGSSGSLHPVADRIHHTYTPDGEPDPSSGLWFFLAIFYIRSSGFSLPRPAPKTLPDRPQKPVSFSLSKIVDFDSKSTSRFVRRFRQQNQGEHGFPYGALALLTLYVAYRTDFKTPS